MTGRVCKADRAGEALASLVAWGKESRLSFAVSEVVNGGGGMGYKKTDRGELLLLGVFGLFTIVFLLDIRTLPMEGKMLSYILAPFIFGLLFLCTLRILTPPGKSKALSGPGDLEPSIIVSGEEEETRGEAEKRWAKRRFFMTVGMGLFLFVAITLLGFYLGSGFMLLVWFISIRRIDLKTLGITLLTPLILYLSFEVLLDMGLPQGALFKWIGF
jgi:hypothetical protein